MQLLLMVVGVAMTSFHRIIPTRGSLFLSKWKHDSFDNYDLNRKLRRRIVVSNWYYPVKIVFLLIDS